MRVCWIALSLLLIMSGSRAIAQSPSADAWETFDLVKSLTREAICPAERQKSVNARLKLIAAEDQSDRINSHDDMARNDLKRRKEIAGFAAEACLLDGESLHYSALVYQHGQTPEHYLTAIQYWMKSYELGYAPAQAFLPVAIDRYLMSLGHKQVFGSQLTAPASYKPVESDEDLEPCVWPVDHDLDLSRDYTFGDEGVGADVVAFQRAQFSQMDECDFPAKPAKAILDALLNLKI